MKRLISIPIVCASLLACSKNNPPAATPPNPDMVTYDTTVSLDTSKNPPAQVTALAEAINGKQEVSFNSISDMIIGDHVAEYNRMEGKTLSLATVQAQISNLASKVQVSQSLGAKKVAYETALESDLGRSIDYNSSKVTLAHPLEEGRQQCYSGSMLSMVVNRKLLTGQDYRTMNFVMIYTDGHQLPGQMVFKDSTWYLTGVETTALGAAEIREVPASQISTDTLVYDAEYTALMEVFKNYISWQEGKRLAYSLRKMTSDRYGIPIPTQVDAERIAAQKLAGQRGSRFRGSNLNSSPFGIGVSKAPAGDLQRSAYVGIGTPGVLSLKAEVQGGFEGPRFPDHPGEMRNNFRTEIFKCESDGKYFDIQMGKRINLSMKEVVFQYSYRKGRRKIVTRDFKFENPVLIPIEQYLDGARNLPRELEVSGAYYLRDKSQSSGGLEVERHYSENPDANGESEYRVYFVMENRRHMDRIKTLCRTVGHL